MRATWLAGLVVALALLAAPALRAQPSKPELGPANGLLLVAKPGMLDPNFRETVVLVSQTEDFRTIGVILNRPTPLRLTQFLADDIPTANYTQPIFFGGPVMRQAIVAVFHADTPPKAAAFHVLKNVWLTTHSDVVVDLLARPEAKYRLYAGFSGWAPRQLESELARDGWYLLPASAADVFRESTQGMWEEMVAKALGGRARLSIH